MDNWLTRVLEWSAVGLLGALGGLASLFYPSSVEMRFTWFAFCSKLVLAFFVGKVAGEFISGDNQYRSGVIMLMGFFAYPVMGVAERKLKAWLESINPGGHL